MAAQSEPWGSKRPVRWLGWVGVWVGIATLGAYTSPFGWAATGLVAVLALVLVTRTVLRPAESFTVDSRLRHGVLVWSLLVSAVVVWELVALSRQTDWAVPDPAHPTLSTLLDPILEHGPGRWLGWLVWLGFGWGLLR